MNCIPQSRYMAIDKLLELQNSAWSVSMWFQYGVKPPCAAKSLYASWHGIKEALDIFLGSVPPRSLYASPQSVKSSCWRTLMNKSLTNNIPDMFDGRHVWRTCRSGKQWASSPALKRRWRTVEAYRSKPVAVLQRRLNTVDEAVGSVTAMWTRWRSFHAVVTLRGPVPAHLCIRPSSLHWFHTCITVIAACPVRAAMSWYDTPASWRPTILPSSNALTGRYCALSRRRGIPALAFTFQLCLEALHWLNKA